MLQVDRLYEAVAQRGPVCVGLDTDPSYLPEGFAQPGRTAGENVFAFNREIIEATKAAAACFKVQIAYYEALGQGGPRTPGLQPSDLRAPAGPPPGRGKFKMDR